MWMRRPDAGHCAAVGEALARMHLAGADFAPRRKNALDVDGWRPLYEQAAERADTVQRDLRATIENELAQLEKTWPRDLPHGVAEAVPGYVEDDRHQYSPGTMRQRTWRR